MPYSTIANHKPFTDLLVGNTQNKEGGGLLSQATTVSARNYGSRKYCHTLPNYFLCPIFFLAIACFSVSVIFFPCSIFFIAIVCFSVSDISLYRIALFEIAYFSISVIFTLYLIALFFIYFFTVRVF